ncbi:MAG: portal protein, partial [Luminiphilus sp.]
MAEMDDYQLSTIVSSEITDALNHFDSEYSQERIRAMDFYMGEPLGNEVEGRSSVVSTEVADTVEAIMPNLMRVFTANDKYVRFNARTSEDVEKAEQVSDYVNYIINHDNEGYKVLYNWFKDALLFRLGVVKYFYEEQEEVDEEEYNGLSEDELVMLLANPDIEVIEQNETVTESYMDEAGELVPLASTYDLSVRVTKRSGKIKIVNVPPEEFLVNRRATSLEDAYFVCHRTTMTVSDLVAMGYDREEVEAHAGISDLDVDEERTNRFQDTEAVTGTDAADPTLREVVYYECIAKIDYDGDGIAERRRICAIGSNGSHILHNEPFDHIPFAVVSPILMPHRLIGRSIYDMTEDLQVIKSTLLRQYLDSVYTSTLPRMGVVEGMVNIDDVLDGTAGGIIRMRQPGMVQPFSGSPVGGEVRPLMDYLDEIKEQRTGMSKASQGLDANALQSTTASAISATVRGAQVKLESYARTMAETGMKSLFKGILHLVTK